MHDPVLVVQRGADDATAFDAKIAAYADGGIDRALRAADRLQKSPR